MVPVLLLLAFMACAGVLFADQAVRRRAAWLLFLLVLAGCATTPKASRIPAGVDCTPPGLPETVWEWPVKDIRQGLTSQTESGVQVSVVMVFFESDGREVIATWIGNYLSAVDLEPQNEAVPVLLNLQRVHQDGTVRAAPDGACRWAPAITGETT